MTSAPTASPGSNKIPATLIPGDGIGPEIMDAVSMVLDALGAPFAWDVQQDGMAGIAESGDPLPQATLIDPPLIDQNANTCIYRHKSGFSALWDSRQ